MSRRNCLHPTTRALGTLLPPILQTTNRKRGGHEKLLHIPSNPLALRPSPLDGAHVARHGHDVARRRLERPRAAAAAVGGKLPDVRRRRRDAEPRGDAAPDVEGVAGGGAEGGLGVEEGGGVGGERGEGGGGVGPGGEEGEGEGCVYYWERAGGLVWGVGGGG